MLPRSLILQALLLASAAAAMAAGTETLSPPDCSRGVTPAQTEGPYFKAGSPAATSLATGGMRGTRIVLTGWVVAGACTPVPGAVLDVWQADESGRYDNSGYTLRGKVTTDAQGRYVLETILPGFYPGRTRHIHVKITAPGGGALTTQLYFPEDTERNRGDSIYDPRLLVRWLDTPGARTARYDFALK